MADKDINNLKSEIKALNTYANRNIFNLADYYFNARFSVLSDFLPMDSINIPNLFKTLKNGFYGLVDGKLQYYDSKYILYTRNK